MTINLDYMRTYEIKLTKKMGNNMLCKTMHIVKLLRL